LQNGKSKICGQLLNSIDNMDENVNKLNRADNKSHEASNSSITLNNIEEIPKIVLLNVNRTDNVNGGTVSVDRVSNFSFWHG